MSEARREPVLEVEDLCTHFQTDDGVVKAVDGVSFTLHRGELLGIVGESGCGKSTLSRAVIRLIHATSGESLWMGKDILKMSSGELTDLRKDVQMIFQDPLASLNPRMTAGAIIAEPLLIHYPEIKKTERMARVIEMMEKVGLSPTMINKYPHEFSGGQRQRISIARALASQPEFLVCDEPTSALDVSVQAQILNLMMDLQRRLKLTYLFISHNLAVVYHISTRVGVMYLGRLVEQAPTDTLFKRPKHPYTRMLLDTIPDLDMTGRQRAPVAGEVPSPINPPTGCTFHPRCPFANERCKVERPLALPIEGGTVACHAIEEGRLGVEDRSYAGAAA